MRDTVAAPCRTPPVRSSGRRSRRAPRHPPDVGTLHTLLATAGVTEDALTAALASFPGVRVADGGDVADRRAAALEENAEVAYVALGLILALTAIAAVNTLAQSTADRSRELALVRLVCHPASARAALRERPADTIGAQT